jgi:ribonuclease J
MSASDLAIVTCHHLDSEFLVIVLGLAKKMGFEVFVSSEMVAKSIKLTGTDASFKVLEEAAESPSFTTAPSHQILGDKSLLITSYYEIIDLFRNLDESDLKSRRSVCILTEPEPASEEMQEYDVMNRWLSMWGIQTYRIRVSGHYYPFDFEEILSAIRPKEMLPLHTFHPELMRRQSKGLGTKK